jgi:hypothetical protein
MTSKNEAIEVLHKMARRRSVFDLEALFDVFDTRSRMTVFRRLRDVGYLSSFTHGGRYYTLRDIARFDDHGLWFHRDIGFSQAGTLKQTAAVQVEQTPEGRTHDELQSLLRVRVHNTLLGLVRDGRLGRERVGRVYLYVSADPERATQQITERQELSASLAKMLRVPTDEEVVEVLVEALRAAPEIPMPTLVAKHLVARGVHLEPHHVQMVYEEHGLVQGKKTARPSSRRSRR